MNQVSLMGNVTHDLELKTSEKNHMMYTQFRLAVDHYSNKEKKTDFIEVVAFGQKAETLTKYLVKGNKLLVTGKLSSEVYQGKDGKKQYRTKVILEDFEFASYKSRGTSEEALEA